MVSQTLHRFYKWELLGLLCATFFLHQADRAIFGVVLKAVQSDLGLSNNEVGVLGTALFLAMALMMPAAGYVGDVFNRKWVVTCSLIFWSTTTLLTGLTGGFIGLLVFRSIATALGEAFYAPAAYPLLAAFHKTTRTIAMSIHQTSLYVGLMVSGVLAGYIADHWGWRNAFFLYGGAGILLGGLLAVRLMNPPSAAGQSDETKKPRVSPLAALSVLLRTPTALLITVSYTAVVLVYNASVFWAPCYLGEKYGLTMAVAGGLVMFCQYIASMVGVLLGGVITDRMVSSHPQFRLQLQCVFMFLCAPAILVMSLADSLVVTCCGVAALGFCQGTYQSNTPAALLDVIDPRYRSSALGVQIMIAYLIGSASPWVLSRFRDMFGNIEGLSYGFASLSCVYVLGGIAALVAVLFTFHKDRCIEQG